MRSRISPQLLIDAEASFEAFQAPRNALLALTRSGELVTKKRSP
jgi:hypothetical protein